MRQNVEDEILAEQHFLRTHTEERRESEAGLIVVRANSNHLVGKREISRQLGPGKLFSKGPPNQIKKDHRSLLITARAPSSYVMFLVHIPHFLSCLS